MDERHENTKYERPSGPNNDIMEEDEANNRVADEDHLLEWIR